MEKTARNLKLIKNISGSGHVSYKLSLPNVWVTEMFPNEEEIKNVRVAFDGEIIIIKKIKD